MNQDEAIEYMWEGKGTFESRFLLADLVEDTEMSVWNGTHPVEENTTKHTAKAGNTILVSVVSRFGDVGIRDDGLDKPEYGYYARVPPDLLTNWRPLDGLGDQAH